MDLLLSRWRSLLLSLWASTRWSWPDRKESPEEREGLTTTAGVKSRPRPLPANKQQPIRQEAYVNSAWCQDLHSPRGGHLDTFLHLVLLLWPNNVEPCTLLLVFSRSNLLELGDFIRRLLGQTNDDYFFGSERKQRLSRKSSSSLTLAQCCS